MSNLRLCGFFFVCLGIIFAAACRTDPVRCEDPLGCVVIHPSSPVRLASLLPISGETAVWGEEFTRGINLAISERGGELLGHDIEIVQLDSGCDAAGGQQAVQSLSDDDSLLAVIGPACSDVAQAVLPVVRRNNWLLISPASTAPTLTAAQSGVAFFRTVPNHLHQAEVAAHFAYEQLGARQTAVFLDETEYNSLLAQAFGSTFSQLGGTVVYQGSLAVGQIEVAPLLAEAASRSPDVIFLALFEPEASLMINRLAELAPLNRAVLLGGDTLHQPDFASRLENIAAKIFVTGPVLAGEPYDAFRAAWESRYEDLAAPVAAAYAYDATHLLLTAIEDAATIGQSGSLLIGRSDLRSRLVATDGWAGATGMLRCGTNGECAAAGYGLYELNTAEGSTTSWPPPLIWQYKEN